MHWGTVPEWLMAGFALATAYYAYQNGKTTRKLERLIGSLESHSTLWLRMAAKDRGLPVLAYDPSQSRFPAPVPRVSEEWKLERVYLAIPPELRDSDYQPKG